MMRFSASAQLKCATLIFGWAGLLLLGIVWVTAPAMALSPQTAQIIRNDPQVLNMAGYVMYGQTNMNYQYAKKWNYGVLKNGEQWDDTPVIIMEKPEPHEIQQERFLLNTPRHWISPTDNPSILK